MKYIHIFLWSNLKFTPNAIIHFLRQSRGTLPTTIAHSVSPHLFLLASLHYKHWLPFSLAANLHWLKTLPPYHFFSGHGWTNNWVFTLQVHLKRVICMWSWLGFALLHIRVSARVCVCTGVDVADSLAPSYWQCKRARDWNADTLCPSVVIKRKAGNNRSALASPWH